nr:arginase family protein [Petropleomorpha daqingensis]
MVAPYDSGHRDVRMGAGPLALLRAGAGELAADVRVLDPAGEWRAELATAFELNRLVAAEVADAVAEGQVPVLLSGNCLGTVGVLAGLAAAGHRVGLLWLDAHGDFNTPDEDGSGFLDGQGLAIAVGRCWRSVAGRIPGFTPLPERDVVLVGARDVTEAQAAVLRSSGLAWLPPAQARDPELLAATLADLAGRVDVLHFHVDLDVHDPSIAPANGYAAPDGLSAEEVRRVLGLAAAQLPVVSATLASWDPSFDVGDRMRDVALDLLGEITAAAVPVAR